MDYEHARSLPQPDMHSKSLQTISDDSPQSQGSRHLSDADAPFSPALVAPTTPPLPPWPPLPPQGLRRVALQARAEARVRAKAWAKGRAKVHAQAGLWVGRAEELAQALGAGVWAVKAHRLTYEEVLADSRLKHIIYSIESHNRHRLASHLTRHSHTTQRYWWLIQIITPITRLPPELLQQILLIIIDDEASVSPLELMLVCKHWYDIVTGIWASLRLGTTTPTAVIETKLERNQWFLDVLVDTELDRGHFTQSEDAYQAIFAAIQATSRWRSFVVETFPPPADLPEPLVNRGLQRCSDPVMNRIRTFKIKCNCEMSPLLDRILRILGTSASRELTTVEINSPSVISFLAPTYPSIFHSVKVLSLDTPGLPNPVDFLPHLHQLESLTASHLSFPIYHKGVNLPFVHTLRHLTLTAVSIQWMDGRTFRALESCKLFLPLHRNILHIFSTTLPNCKHLTFQGYPLNILNGVSAHSLTHLSVTCSSSNKLRGNRELVRFSSQALRADRLAPRILHISIEAMNEAWIKALDSMSNLDELVIHNALPSSLKAKVLRSLVIHSVHATPGGRNTPVCPSLKRFGLRYHRWLRPSEHLDLIPELMSIILSRQWSKFSLQSFQIWIGGAQKDPLELIDGSWISLDLLQVMASILVENMIKPSGKFSSACPQPPPTPLLLQPLPYVLPPRLSFLKLPLLDSLKLDPYSLNLFSETVRVLCSYKGQRYKEIDLIESEYIYDVEKIDSRWCIGTTEDGKRGLFPTSHVELLIYQNTLDPSNFKVPLAPTEMEEAKWKGSDDDSIFKTPEGDNGIPG